eukprot:scaffold17193_cov69-Phaeocystis_antarctica.AAC.1
MFGCMHALLLATASTHLLDVNGRSALQWAGGKGQPNTAERIQQHAAPPLLASPVAPPDAVEAAVSSPATGPLEIVHAAQRGELRELLKRGASVDLQSSLGTTALQYAALHGHLSTLLLLLQHSANPDLPNIEGHTALMLAAGRGQETCVQALLRAEANTELLDKRDGRTALQHAEGKGHTAIAELIRQHAAPPQSTVSAATSPDAVEPAAWPAASLPAHILQSAWRGELQTVATWLNRGGLVDALRYTAIDGRAISFGLLHAATTFGHLEMVRELLKRGASVDLLANLGTTTTALMGAARNGHLSVLLLLLEHSANPDLQTLDGQTALIMAAVKGQEACVQALLRAEANTELLDTRDGHTALQWAEAEGHTAIAELIRQHAAPPQSTVSAATSPDAVEPAAGPAASLPAHILRSARRGELQTVAD